MHSLTSGRHVISIGRIAGMNVREARQLFPALREKVFLDTAAQGLLPEPVRSELAGLVDLVTYMRGADTEEVYEAMVEERTQAAASIARLIGCTNEEVALVESTTHGLNVVALSLPLRPGDEVLMPDTEFLQVPMPWARLGREQGVELRFFPTRKGVFDVEDVERAVTQRTKVLTFSSVQWASGFRCDLDAIVRFCRRCAIVTVVDAIQHVGAMVLDVKKTPADFVTSGGHKWLNAPFGCGFLYIRKGLLRKLSPPMWGYQGLGDPPGGWEHYFHRPSITPKRAFRFPKRASAFEIGGTANYPGALALKVSAGIAEAIGVDAIEGHIHALVGRFLDGLDELGIRVVSARRGERSAGIVAFRAYPKPEEDLGLVHRLRERKILVSMRYTSRVGGIRASFHYYNNEDDVDALLDAIRELR